MQQNSIDCALDGRALAHSSATFQRGGDNGNPITSNSNECARNSQEEGQEQDNSNQRARNSQEEGQE